MKQAEQELHEEIVKVTLELEWDGENLEISAEVRESSSARKKADGEREFTSARQKATEREDERKCLVTGIGSEENVQLANGKSYINIEAIRSYLPLLEAFVAERAQSKYRADS